MSEAVSLIANRIAPAAIVPLLAMHVDDGHGHCRTCTLGAQHGNCIWPCLIHAAATLAAHRREVST
ncbi:MAG: hypothetical protein ACRDQ0_06640 [Pseudonocardia sp.]